VLLNKEADRTLLQSPFSLLHYAIEVGHCMGLQY